MLVERLADYERLRATLGHPDRLRLTLDLGHVVCLEPMSVAQCVRRAAPTRTCTSRTCAGASTSI